jgi:hypothetical protein
MICQEVMELMQRQLDQDLSDQEYEQLIAHLGDCPSCTEIFERLTKLSNDLENLPKVVPPYSLVDAILPQLDEWDRTGNIAPIAAKAAQSSMESRSSLASPRRESRQRSRGYGIFGGVLAASLILGMIFFNGDTFRMGTANESSMIQDHDQSNKVFSNEALHAPKADGSAERSTISNESVESPESPSASNDSMSLKAAPDGDAGSPALEAAPEVQATEGEMKMMGTSVDTSNELRSNDGTYQAVVEKNKVIVYTQNKVVYESTINRSDENTINLTSWTGSYTLEYELLTKDGVSKWLIDLKQQTEIELK